MITGPRKIKKWLPSKAKGLVISRKNIAGVTNPELALRSAQIGSDTTPELNAAATGIREGAEVLKEAGNLQMQLAQNQVIEAQNVYVNAKGKLGENVKAATTEAQTLQQSQKAAIQSANMSSKVSEFVIQYKFEIK